MVLVNYADGGFYEAQRKNAASGLVRGGFDDCWMFGRSALDEDFVARASDILDEPRGAGYWAWKPQIIIQALRRLPEGGFVMYADSGSLFVHSALPLVGLCAWATSGVLVFEFPSYTHRQWVKRDAFVLLGRDGEKHADEKLRIGSYLVVRNCGFGREFVHEWLECCLDRRLVTDDPNTCGLPNYDGFREHRHDQSVLSLLSHKHGIGSFRDPSQFGNGHAWDYGHRFPQIIQHTRERK